mgnify:CR=1 FL=1|tara:strand:- start:2488 stop:2889 length:402 start_codon:yes stop_codon:yes gene_type:complete
MESNKSNYEKKTESEIKTKLDNMQSELNDMKIRNMFDIKDSNKENKLEEMKTNLDNMRNKLNNIMKKKKKMKCFLCKKKIKSVIPIKCRCEQYFCRLHKMIDEHDCSFDYQGNQKKKISKYNPKIEHHKFEKL